VIERLPDPLERLPDPDPPPERAGSLQWVGMLSVAMVAIVADQVTKRLVSDRVGMDEVHQVLPFLDVRHVRNTGIAFGACGSAKIARNSGGDLCWRRAQVVRHRGGRIDEGQRRWRARSMHKKRLSMRSAVFAIIFLANQTGAGDPTARTQRRRAHRSRSRSGARSQRGRARKVAATVCRAGPGR